MAGIVYIVNDEVRQQKGTPGEVVEVPGADVLACADGDGKFCQPDDKLLTVLNLRILLTSPLRSRMDQRWLVCCRTLGVERICNRIVRYFLFTNLLIGLLTVHRIFLSGLNIILRRLRKPSNFVVLTLSQCLKR